MKAISKMTRMILQQPSDLTNRQVADRLKIDIETVKQARRRHGIALVNPRNRGLAENIAALYMTGSAASVARKIGCSAGYVQNIWRSIRNERIN